MRFLYLSPHYLRFQAQQRNPSRHLASPRFFVRPDIYMVVLILSLIKIVSFDNYLINGVEEIMKAVIKWISGIVAGVLTGVLIWQFTQPKPNGGGAQQGGENPVVKECSVSGTVYNRDNNNPLPGIEIRYPRRTPDPDQYLHNVRSRLATTGDDGKFSFDCSSIEKENFPLRIELNNRNWRGITHQTDEYIQQDTKRNDINIYVSDQTLRSIGSRTQNE